MKTAECDEQGNVKCEDQEVCILGFCRNSCIIDEDCEFGEKCIERSGKKSYCIDPDEPCKIACDEEQVCINGVCVLFDEDGEISDDVEEEILDDLDDEADQVETD